MTKAAHITYGDMLRTMRAVRAAGIEHARIIMRPERGEIEVVLGAAVLGSESDLPGGHNPWDDE
jgi:hypothetical protein